jgi:hypothetical protein
MATPGYCCDADGLIEIARHFADGVRRLSKAAKEGRFCIPSAVSKELKRKSDNLGRSLETWRGKYGIVIAIDANQQLKRENARVERTYGPEIKLGGSTRPGFWKSKQGEKAADGHVVTVAKVLKIVAVSQDQAVRDACLLEDVECIGWQEFWRRITGGPGGQGALGI